MILRFETQSSVGPGVSALWPALILASLAGIVLFDLRVAVPVASIAWFIPADTIEVLIAATGLRFCFGRAPRLNHINSVAKYKLFAVLLAPCVAAFVSARGIPGDYWTSWRISFLSEVLAFITLPPAILSWASEGPAWLSAREGRETSPARQRVVGAQLRR